MSVQMSMFGKKVVKQPESNGDWNKYRKKLLKDGFEVSKRRVDGCLIETFTKGK